MHKISWKRNEINSLLDKNKSVRLSLHFKVITTLMIGMLSFSVAIANEPRISIVPISDIKKTIPQYNEYKVRLYNDLPSAPGARRHYELMRELQSISYKFDYGSDLVVPGGPNDIATLRANTMHYASAKYRDPSYVSTVAANALQDVPVVGWLVNDPTKVDPTATTKNFNDVVDYDQYLRNIDPVYKELVEQSEKENLGYRASDDHSLNANVMQYHETKARVANGDHDILVDIHSKLAQQQKENKEKQKEYEAKLKSEERRRQLALDRENVIGYMNGTAYALQLLGEPELAAKVQKASYIMSETSKLMDASSQMTAGAAFAGWVGVAVVAVELMSDSSDKASETQMILEAIQELTKQMHERFDRMEDMLIGVGLDIVRLQIDQSYLFTQIKDLKRSVDNINRTIRSESELSKYDDLLELQLKCEGILNENISVHGNRKNTLWCLDKVFETIRFGISGVRVNIYPVTEFQGVEPSFTELVEMFNTNNPYGNINLIAYINSEYLKDKTLNSKAYPNAFLFEKFYELFVRLHSRVGSNILDRESMIAPIEEKRNELIAVMDFIRTKFIFKYAKLLDKQLGSRNYTTLNSVLESLQVKEAFNLMWTGDDDMFTTTPVILDPAKTKEVHDEIIKTIMTRSQAADLDVPSVNKDRYIHYKKQYRGPLLDANTLMVEEFTSAILKWFPNINTNGDLRYVGQVHTDFISPQEVVFEVVPRNSLARTRKGFQFILRIPKMSNPRQMPTRDGLRKLIEESKTKSMSAIRNAALNNKRAVLAEAAGILTQDYSSLTAAEQGAISGTLDNAKVYYASLNKLIYSYDKEFYLCEAYQSFYNTTLSLDIKVNVHTELMKAFKACGRE